MVMLRYNSALAGCTTMVAVSRRTSSRLPGGIVRSLAKGKSMHKSRWDHGVLLVLASNRAMSKHVQAQLFVSDAFAHDRGVKNMAEASKWCHKAVGQSDVGVWL